MISRIYLATVTLPVGENCTILPINADAMTGFTSKSNISCVFWVSLKIASLNNEYVF